MSLSRDIVMFATADWDNPFWTNKQHIAARLAQRGFRVLYVESLGLRRPTVNRRDLRRIAVRLRRGIAGLRPVRERLWVWSPLALPFHRARVVRRLNRRLLLSRLRRRLHRLRFDRPIIWTYNPLVVELADRLPRDLLVYHCVDDLTAAPGMPAEAIRQAEAALVRAADLVFVTTPALRERCIQYRADNVHDSPNVADFDHFSVARQPGSLPDDLQAVPRPRIGFVGAISNYKVDFELIAAVAQARPDWHWVLIGQPGEGQPGTDLSRLRRPNIHLMGPRDYRSLPHYLRGFDVAALPCPRNDYTRAMSPMKFMEYLAAGRPVVATPLEALKDYPHAYWPAASAAEFQAAIERVLQGDSPDPALCLRLAKEHTWERRLDRMVERMEAARAKPAPTL